MKKNYLLLFLIALLFSTATMRADMLKFGDIKADKRYYLKIGNGFLFLPEVVDSFRIKKGVKKPAKIARGKIACFTDQAKATKLKFSPEQGGTSLIESFEASDYKGKYGGPIGYSIDGEILSTGITLFSFNYVNEGGKYYLKAAEVDAGAGKYYLTNKAGKVTLEATASPDAVIEFFDPNGANQAEVAEHLKKMLNRLSFFQSYRHQLGDKSQDSPFLGNGLGQYPRPNIPSTNAIIKEEWSYFSVNMYRKDFAGLKGDDATASNIEIVEHCEANLHINKPQAGTYVVISTKSQYEDKIRLNDNRSSELNFTPGSAAGASQPAKYLVAKATGYELTTDKAKASVFYFDGDHLTGLDYGFGLNTTQNKYDLTADAQKAVVAQGKLEKTLDAGSYSLKVGNKFVKLDNTSGLSVTDNESESHIFLEEATKFTLHTDALGYVSFYAPTAVKVPADVKVYTGKLNAGNTQLTFTEVSNKQIPAGTAVLLQKGTSKTQFEVEKIANASAITANNSLKGYTVSSADRKNNAYGLMAENGKLVFKRLSDGVRAFRAVIYQNNGAGTQEFILTSFAPTAIEGVTAEEKQEEVFDLAGRRVEYPVKGQVYVKGGKKFIQK